MTEIEQEKEMVLELKSRIENTINLVYRWGGTDGAHHKQWLIDQMIRELTGKDYNVWVRGFCDGEDGPDTYEWEVGIAP